MKLFARISVLLFLPVQLASALSGDDQEELFGSLDTNREASVLTVGVRKGDGAIYVDTMETESLSTIDLDGEELLDITMSMLMENTVEVMDLPGGGKSIDATIKHIRFQITESARGVETSLLCDYSEEQSEPPPDCVEFGLNLRVGQSQHFVVDDEGTISDGLGDSAGPHANVGPSEQVQHTSRLLQLIPYHPIASGDSWDVSADYGEMGSFIGTATLLGYTDFEGFDCAAILVTGKMHFELEFLQNQISASLSFDDGEVVTVVSLSEGPMLVKMLWDNELQLARYSKSEITHTVEYKVDYDDGIMKETAMIEMPLQSITITHSQVKEDKQ